MFCMLKTNTNKTLTSLLSPILTVFPQISQKGNDLDDINCFLKNL